MKLENYLNLEKLEEYINDGLIRRQQHPVLPLTIYNYTHDAQFRHLWPHEVCGSRGLIVDDQNNIISRPQYKFFNLGQEATIMVNRLGNEEDMSTTVVASDKYLRFISDEFHRPLTITRKMDGQMGVLWNYGDQWGIATRGSFTSEGAVFATERFQKFVKYGAAQDFIPEGWTLIFEIVAKHLRIVIPYDWEGLCLLTAVNNETGEEMSYDQLHEMWMKLNSYSKTIDADGVEQPGKPWCRIVEKFDIALETAVLDPSLEEEGYVIAVNRPGMPPVKVKVKLEEYKRLHRLLTNLTPQMIWEACANPTKPWVTVDTKYDRSTGATSQSMMAPVEFRQWIEQWRQGMTKAFHELLAKAITAQTDLRTWENGDEFGLSNIRVPKFKHDTERKQWLMSPNGGGHSKEVVNAAMLLRSGKVKEAYDLLWTQVRPHGREEHFFTEGAGE